MHLSQRGGVNTLRVGDDSFEDPAHLEGVLVHLIDVDVSAGDRGLRQMPDERLFLQGQRAASVGVTMCPARVMLWPQAAGSAARQATPSSPVNRMPHNRAASSTVKAVFCEFPRFLRVAGDVFSCHHLCEDGATTPMRVLVLVCFLTATTAFAQQPPVERWAAELAAFEAADRAAPPPKGEIVFVGSSTIKLWDLAKSFPDLKTINRGIIGSSMGDAVREAPRLVIPHQPRKIGRAHV